MKGFDDMQDQVLTMLGTDPKTLVWGGLDNRVMSVEAAVKKCINKQLLRRLRWQHQWTWSVQYTHQIKVAMMTQLEFTFIPYAAEGKDNDIAVWDGLPNRVY
jgi:hypothetical protein